MLTLLFIIHSQIRRDPSQTSLEIADFWKFCWKWIPFSLKLWSVEENNNNIPQKLVRMSIKASDCDNFNSESSSSVPQSVSNMSLEDKFKAAVKVIHSLPKDGPYQPSNGTKLKFYGLFKQATEGPCNISKPGFWDVVGKYKWEAWNDLGNMAKESAMEEYVNQLKQVGNLFLKNFAKILSSQIVETMSWDVDGNVEDFLNSIGPFYEFVNLQGNELIGIKEKIEEFTSGSSSGGSSSSGISSPEASPIKNGNVGKVSDGEDAEGEKVEVQVENRTATYESNSATANPNTKTNGHIHPQNSSSNGHHSFPPPTPQHTRSRKSSLAYISAQSALRESESDPRSLDDDETLDIKLTNGYTIGHVQTKEDLEDDIPPPPKNVAINSGTESEKYYSGESEPEYSSKRHQKQISFVSKPVASSSSKGRKSSPKIPSSNCSASELMVERMSRDIDHVLARLRILETAYAASVENRRALTPFGGMSYAAISFFLAWPFASYFIIWLLRSWFRRRRRQLN